MADSTTIRMEKAEVPNVAPLAMVELDRRSGASWHLRFGQVELVDHVVAWVFEDGLVLAAIVRRSALTAGRVVTSRTLSRPRQASLSDIERLDILHAAGLRPVAAHEPTQPRWEVA